MNSPASAVWNILNRAGIDPAPRRSGPEHMVAVDFLHVDTVNLTRLYALIMLEHGSRRAHLLGVTANPTGSWTAQAVRNLLMNTGTEMTKRKVLIHDRGGQFTHAFDAVFADAGLQVLKSPPQAPKANAHSERIIGTLRRELLDSMLILDEHHPATWITTTRPDLTATSDSYPQRKPKPDRQPPSTWPTNESTAEPSSAASSTSTGSPADQVAS